MKRLALFFLCFLALQVLAQDLVIDPPLTKQEERSLRDMRKQWKRSGMPPMTHEQEVQMILNMRETQARMMGQAMGIRAAVASGAFAVPTQPAPTMPAVAPIAPDTMATPASDDLAYEGSPEKKSLKTHMDEHSVDAQFTKFERMRDGFKANGVPILDVDGAIIDFGADTQSGNVTYLIGSGQNVALVKHRNMNSDYPAFMVGRLETREDQVFFRAVDGTSSAGNSVIPTANGLLFTREGSLVRYQVGEAPSALPLPDGYTLAEYQNGDVSGTGYVLLERAEKSMTGPKAIGNSLGALIGKRDQAADYALFNPDTGDLLILYVNSSRNQVGQGTGCKRQNDLVNKCSGWQRWSSIWRPDGSPNYLHYYWSIMWQQTRFGPVAIVQENGVRDVNAIRLGSGERTTIFSRGLGVDNFQATLTPDGDLQVTASMGFKSQTIESLEAVL